MLLSALFLVLPSPGSALTGSHGESFAELIEAAKVKNCQPASFCTWNTTTKTCNDLTADGKDSGVDTICRWAVADLHCPDGGCLSAVFTLPTRFAPVANNPIPPVACLKDARPWNVSLSDPEKTDKYTPEQIAGSCYHSPKLENDFCK